MSPILQVKNLSYICGEHCLLHDLSFSVNHNEILQIVGPNGVGKTTLLRVLSGLLLPDQGQVFWKERSIQDNLLEYCRSFFYLGHERGVKEDLTVSENLRFDIRYQTPKYNAVCDVLIKFQLENFAEQLCGKLSQGQRLRVALAKLCLSEAKLWILDEPFSTLDTAGVELMYQIMQQHIFSDGAIILTTHRPLQADNLSIRSLSLTPSAEQGVNL